jgi:hypothetical protein
MLRILPLSRKGAKNAKKYLLPIAIGILCVPPRLSASAVKIEIQTIVKLMTLDLRPNS